MGKYALIIGCNTYEDERLMALTSPSSDVQRLAEILNSPLIGGFDQVTTKMDSQYDDVKLAIADLFADKKADDLLLLYFSGHGILDIQGRLSLAACNTNRNRLSVTGISSSFINDEMDSSNSRRQILILDCCYSGAFHKGTKGEIGNQAISQATFESEGYAKIVITATNATQYALEGNQVVGNASESLFTYYLLQGLESGDADKNQDGDISIGEWYEFAFEQIAQNYQHQTPKIWVYGQQGRELVIAKSLKLGARLASSDLGTLPGIIDNKKFIEYIDHLPFCTLKLNKRASVINKSLKKDVIDHQIICGDNLLVLKALIPYYASKIKCIYIDPPYNLRQGKQFDFQSFGEPTKENIKSGKDSNESDNNWNNLIYPRLILARDLLSDDGILFVSIDDNEIHHMRFMLDWIYGSINHLCTFVWKKRKSPSYQNRNGISVDHEYILCYSKSPDFRFKGQERDLSKYSNSDNDPKGPWMAVSITGLSDENVRPSFHYDITNPVTGNVFHPPKGRGWKFTPEKMNQLILDGKIFWPKNLSGQPRMKRYLSEVNKSLPISTVIDEISLASSSQDYSNEKTFIFNSPKPVNLIKLFIDQIPDNDFWIADLFCGSATTGQATIELNGEDNGNRKFILIEADPEIAKKIALHRMKEAISRDPNQHRSQLLFYNLDNPAE